MPVHYKVGGPKAKSWLRRQIDEAFPDASSTIVVCSTAGALIMLVAASQLMAYVYAPPAQAARLVLD